jgi:hypothetical protein
MARYNYKIRNLFGSYFKMQLISLQIILNINLTYKFLWKSKCYYNFQVLILF